MAKKPVSLFICSACGEEYARWAGKCVSCGEWNSILESTETRLGKFDKKSSPKERKVAYSLPVSIGSVPESEWGRSTTGFSELDLVLGGGIVPGSLVLLGGEPGVGKSTLVLEMCRALAKSGKVLYVSGEESSVQIGLRAKRMKIIDPNILLSSEIYVDKISEMVEDILPKAVFIDSIQTVMKESLLNQVGTITQLRESTQVFLETSKRTGVPIFLIGHITKEGSIAGPKVLEHLVDTVLYFEGDKLNYYRILRAVKNRFGAVGDTAIFEMSFQGLTQVTDRNNLFLTRELEERTGSVLSSVIAGSRSLAVEVQSLVTKSSYGQARRMAEGLDSRRLILLCAVLEKFLDLPLSACDIFANLAGGLHIDEPSLDLAIAAAVASSFWEKPFSGKIGILGEVGLSGEIRSIGQISLRLKELQSLGLEKVFLPKGNWEEAKGLFPQLEISPIRQISELTGIFQKD